MFILCNPDGAVCDNSEQGGDGYDIFHLGGPGVEVENVASLNEFIDELMNIVLSMAGPPCEIVDNEAAVVPQELRGPKRRAGMSCCKEVFETVVVETLKLASERYPSAMIIGDER